MTHDSGSAPNQSIVRFAFGFYTAGLLTATHWPGLAIRGPIDRIDLVIHASVFMIWVGLLGKASRLSLRKILVLGFAFAVLDETTQPFFSRVFDWLDLAADMVGILCGVLFTYRTRT